MLKLIKYLRENLLGVAVGCAVTSFLLETLVLHSNLLVTKFTALLVFVAAAFEKRRDNQIRQKQLLKRGLTLKDIQNIEFVKNWEMLRKRGIYKYCFIEGGIMIGLIILLPISLIGIFLFNDIRSLFNEPIDMLKYLALCTVIGYIGGIIIYLIRWVNNEKRFINLTDPLR
jgi:hypothetical protein